MVLLLMLEMDWFILKDILMGIIVLVPLLSATYKALQIS